MSSMVIAYRTNDLICLALGYCTNGTLLWLVLKRSEEDMKPYKPILLLQTIVDLVYLAVCALVVPVLLYDRGNVAAFSLGPLGDLPQPFCFIHLSVYFFFYWFFSTCAQSVPFLYRYMVLCRGREWGLPQFLTMLIGPVIATLIGAQGYPGTPAEQQHAREVLLNGTVRLDFPFTVGYFTRKERADWLSRYVLMLTIINYSLVFGCGWRMQRFVREKMKSVEVQRAREVNRQVITALLLQTFVPMLMQTLPRLALSMSLMLGISLIDYTVYFSMAFPWGPVVNPLIAMWVVKAYRGEVKKWLTCKGNAVAPESTMGGQVGSLQNPNKNNNPTATR